MKILIAYDGSECADRALDDLCWAGLPREAEALVMTVSEVWLPPPPPSSYEIMEQAANARSAAELQRNYEQDSPAVEEARALAVKACAEVRARFSGWHARAEACCGSPAWDIIRRSNEWGADLIVVGSHGRSALGRFFLGSVSQKVVTEAPASVRVARGGRIDEPDTPVRVLLGVDGSHGAALAVGEVARRAWPPGSEALVVVVDDPLTENLVGRIIPPVARWVERDEREERAWVRQLANRAANELRAAGLDASAKIVEGDPRRMLVETAEGWGADSVFVGSTGASSRFEKFLLGSVSAAVVARAHCSVEVVRPRADEG
jgi:nucleotide-binding universal stress UspA family protein